MKCLRCGSSEDKVIDSRASKDGNAIRRRRECLECSYRFTTYEQIERGELTVVKRNDRREPFSREKLQRSLMKACEKRPVPIDALEDAAELIVNELHAAGEREVESQRIGTLVMNELAQIDPVAYVRYASVYRQFQDVGEFIDEIQSLRAKGGGSPRRLQPELFPKN